MNLNVGNMNYGARPVQMFQPLRYKMGTDTTADRNSLTTTTQQSNTQAARYL